MHVFLVQTHSLLRYLALIMLIVMLVSSFRNMMKKGQFTEKQRKFASFTMMAFHVQLVIGIVLYFMSSKVVFNAMTMKNGLLRFFTLEHPLLMIIALALITIGYIKAKKANSEKSHRILFIFGIIVLFILMLAIPWPFRGNLGTGWL